MNFGDDNDEGSQPAFHMTAMVDMVFMLLAFFILASQFRTNERDFTMGHGATTVLTQGAKAEDFPPHIPVCLQRAGDAVEITIADARLGADNFDGIRAKLAEINMPALGVRILAEADLTVGQVTRALDAVLASPMKDVSVARLTVSRAAPEAAAPGG